MRRVISVMRRTGKSSSSASSRADDREFTIVQHPTRLKKLQFLDDQAGEIAAFGAFERNMADKFGIFKSLNGK